MGKVLFNRISRSNSANTPGSSRLRAPWLLVWLTALCLVAVCANLTQAFAASGESVRTQSDRQAWALSVDNDLFVPFASSDRDFTGGLALTYSGSKGVKYWRKFDSLLGKIDSLVDVDNDNFLSVVPSVEFGLYGFTPDDIETVEADMDDRPYASLVYLAVNRMYPASNHDNSITTSLTLGVLGTDIVSDTQNELHRAVGNAEAKGWHNQISDGGELTARYQIAYHDYWESNTFSSRFKTTYFTSLGYLTEAGVALSTRQGLISSPDHRFNPELISYGERVNEMAATPNQGQEHYFWGGIALKARLYNAFLQGQFKDSRHALDFDDLNPLIVEAWVGYIFTLGREYKVSYVLRGQSSELRKGEGDRGHLWGGVVLGRYI